jgi:hypothetical protein
LVCQRDLYQNRSLFSSVQGVVLVLMAAPAPTDLQQSMKELSINAAAQDPAKEVSLATSIAAAFTFGVWSFELFWLADV